MRQTWISNGCALAILQTATTAFASLDTIGPFGINSAGLTRFDGMPLNGDGIVVGQVEELRPAVPGYDDAGNSNSNIQPAGVYIQAGGNAPP